MKRMIAFSFVLLTLAITTISYAESVSVVSPKKDVKMTIDVGPSLTWSVQYLGKTVLLSSNLGLVFKDQPTFGEMKVIRKTSTEIDQTWHNPVGKKSLYRDHCTETTVDLEEVSGPNRRMTLVVRVYEDGLAIRYRIPEQEEFKKYVVTEERTQFAFNGNWNCWPSDHGKFNTTQEKPFPKARLSDIKADSFVICPLVIHSDEFGYAAITESDLIGWPGMQFAAAERPNCLKVRLTPRRDGNGLAVGQAPLQSPWRVMLLGKTAVDLVNNSGVILNVATPSVLKDTDWIQPGASSWDWWSEGNIVLSTETFKARVDLAAEMGWKYTTLDDPWYLNTFLSRKPGEKPDTTKGSGLVDLPEAIRYANSKGVGIFVWTHYGDLLETGAEKTFALYKKWGVKGVKIDYMDSDCQEMVESLDSLTALAAKYHLMVNYHGMYKPTGMERTFPNQLTREGVLGNEYNKFSNKMTSEHCATMPFTRYLCGPGDFTPGGFINVQPERFKPQKKKMTTPPCMEKGTRAHALALCAIIDSPLLTICDRPESYKDQPGADFLKNIPAVWDDTIALAGEIGKYYVVARRSGDTFYAAAITNSSPRMVTLPLSFLKPEQKYSATIYADTSESAKEATKISVQTKSVDAQSVLLIEMVRNGGWTAIFTPAE